MYTHTHTHTHTHRVICTYTCIHTHIHAHMHACVCTHIHTLHACMCTLTQWHPHCHLPSTPRFPVQLIMVMTLWSRMQWPEILDCNFTEALTIQTHFLLVNSHSPLPIGELSLITSCLWTLTHHFLSVNSHSPLPWWILTHHFLLVNSCSPLLLGDFQLTTSCQWTPCLPLPVGELLLTTISWRTLTHHFLLVNSHSPLPIWWTLTHHFLGELSLTNSCWWTLAHQRDQTNCRWAAEKNVWAKSSNMLALSHLCQTLHQWSKPSPS